MEERIEVVEQQKAPEIPEHLQKITKDMELVRDDVERIKAQVSDREKDESRPNGAMLLALYYAATISSAVCSYLVIRFIIGALDS